MNERIRRLMSSGRVFVARGRDVEQLVALLHDAEIHHNVRHTHNGWWVAFTQES